MLIGECLNTKYKITWMAVIITIKIFVCIWTKIGQEDKK